MKTKEKLTKCPTQIRTFKSIEGQLSDILCNSKCRSTPLSHKMGWASFEKARGRGNTAYYECMRLAELLMANYSQTPHGRITPEYIENKGKQN